jgi:hypothetical protein
MSAMSFTKGIRNDKRRETRSLLARRRGSGRTRECVFEARLQRSCDIAKYYDVKVAPSKSNNKSSPASTLAPIATDINSGVTLCLYPVLGILSGVAALFGPSHECL